MRKTTIGFVLIFPVLLVVIAIGVIVHLNQAKRPELQLVVVGPTNVAGVPGVTFEIQRDGGGRVNGGGYYLMGKEHLEPSRGWCSKDYQIVSHRLLDSSLRPLTNIAKVPWQFLASFSEGARSGTQFWVPAPKNCLVWRVGANFDPEMRPIARMRFRLQGAWKSKQLSYLTSPMFLGTESTWVESCLITNAQPTAAPNDGPATPPGDSGAKEGRHR